MTNTTITGLIIGIIIFSGVILGIISFENGLFNTYNINTNITTELSKYNYLNNTYEGVEAVRKKVESGVNSTATDYLGDLAYMGWQGIIVSFKAISNYIKLLVTIPSEELGIPTYITTIGISIILVIFIMTLLSAILRYQL